MLCGISFLYSKKIVSTEQKIVKYFIIYTKGHKKSKFHLYPTDRKINGVDFYETTITYCRR